MDNKDNGAIARMHSADTGDGHGGYSAGRKHVSRACLECRKKHSKCDGELPKCRKCVLRNRPCTYVESHRGGSRKKGVKNENKKAPGVLGEVAPQGVPDIEDMVTLSTAKANDPQKARSRVRRPSDDESLLQELFSMPCAQSGHVCKNECGNKDVLKHFKNRSGDLPLSPAERDMIMNLRKRSKIQSSVANIDMFLAEKNQNKKQIRSFEDMNLATFYTDNRHLIDLEYLDQEEILENYYTTFHKPHPFLPPSADFDQFALDPSIATEMLLIMKVVSDGQTMSKYNTNLNLISDVVLQCLNVVRQNQALDIVSVQVLLLISIVAHVSSLHVLSRDIRHFCIYLMQQLGIHMVDAPGPKSGSQIAFLHSPRVQMIPHHLLMDSARRIYWELYFFEIIMGSADGKTLSALANIEAHVNYPLSPPRDVFDYDGRAKTGALVSEAIEMNQLMIQKKPIETKRARLRANLSSWEMKLSDPKLFGAPPLVHNNGRVNEGVHQSILLFNYAMVFAYRPFSLLWKINSPQNPQCGPNEAINSSDLLPQPNTKSASIIDTRKTISAADSIVELLINTNSSKVLERSPVFACALALSSLVHISAYIWGEQVLKDSLGLVEGISHHDLEMLAENIKLALSAIYPISQHWILSGKLVKHIRESLAMLRPQLYSQLKNFLPQVQVAIEPPAMPLSPSNEPEFSEGSARNNTSDTSSSSNPLTDLNKLDGVTIPNDLISNNPLFDDNKSFNQLLNSDTGCDWIDKTLIDFFDSDDMVI